MRDGENPMILRMLQLGRLAALLLVSLAFFGAAPASAGCGYNGCYAAAPVVIEPQPVYYQSCSTCCGGCGSAYYTSYYPAYTYPAAYYAGSGCGGCGYGYGYAGYGYGAGYGYAGAVAAAAFAGAVVGPRFYRRGYLGRRY
jgi:hypothetical protein